ncbi:MAG: DUF5681 domain-containing protein [Acetobacteraceae bacterium]|nr:DUF5681 domain-containing protein [Acetobacteraceae bacterium]
MPFMPGQSGNPGGRPRALKDVEEAARAHTTDAIRTLASICKSRKAPDAARVAAANALLDRAWGRPKQRNEQLGPDGVPIGARPLVMLKIER